MTNSIAPSFAIPVSPFAQKLGIVCERVERDGAVYFMGFLDDNVTIGDVVHGGAICSLADVAATRVVKRGGTICFIEVEVRIRPSGDLVANGATRCALSLVCSECRE